MKTRMKQERTGGLHRAATCLTAAALLAAGCLAAAPAALANSADGTKIPDDGYVAGAHLDVTLPDGLKFTTKGILHLKSNVGCPEGWRTIAEAMVLAGNSSGLIPSKAVKATDAKAAAWGLTGNPIDTDVNMTYSFSVPLGPVPESRKFYIGVACGADYADLSQPFNTDQLALIRWIVSDPILVAEDGSLSVGSSESSQAVPTVTLAGETDNTDGRPTITATVGKPDNGGTATDATGKVQFYQDGTQVAEVQVANGLASYTPETALAGSEAGESYEFTAKYVSAGSDDPYADSAVSNTLTVVVKTTSAEPVDRDVTITVTIPSSGLALTVSDTTLDLGTPTSDGTNISASKALPTLTVTDTRFQKNSWTLSGSGTALTTTADGTSIKANYLGWSAPTVAGTGATAGAAKAPGSGTSDGFASGGNLATGTNATTTTTVDANAELKVPVSDVTPEAQYKGTLTFTLV